MKRFYELKPYFEQNQNNYKPSVDYISLFSIFILLCGINQFLAFFLGPPKLLVFAVLQILVLSFASTILFKKRSLLSECMSAYTWVITFLMLSLDIMSASIVVVILPDWFLIVITFLVLSFAVGFLLSYIFAVRYVEKFQFSKKEKKSNTISVALSGVIIVIAWTIFREMEISENLLAFVLFICQSFLAAFVGMLIVKSLSLGSPFKCSNK